MEIESLNRITKNGGEFMFSKDIILKVYNDCNVTIDELNIVNQYSLCFKYEESIANNDIEIYGDGKLWEDAPPLDIIKLVLEQSPIRTYKGDQNVVSFFEFKNITNQNIIITVENDADQVQWYFDVNLDDVVGLYAAPFIKIK